MLRMCGRVDVLEGVQSDRVQRAFSFLHLFIYSPTHCRPTFVKSLHGEALLSLVGERVVELAKFAPDSCRSRVGIGPRTPIVIKKSKFFRARYPTTMVRPDGEAFKTLRWPPPVPMVPHCPRQP